MVDQWNFTNRDIHNRDICTSCSLRSFSRADLPTKFEETLKTERGQEDLVVFKMTMRFQDALCYRYIPKVLFPWHSSSCGSLYPPLK